MVLSASAIFDVALTQYHRHGNRERASEVIALALTDTRDQVINEVVTHFTKLSNETVYAENQKRWDMVLAELQEFKKRKGN